MGLKPTFLEIDLVREARGLGGAGDIARVERLDHRPEGLAADDAGLRDGILAVGGDAVGGLHTGELAVDVLQHLRDLTESRDGGVLGRTETAGGSSS